MFQTVTEDNYPDMTFSFPSFFFFSLTGSTKTKIALLGEETVYVNTSLLAALLVTRRGEFGCVLTKLFIWTSRLNTNTNTSPFLLICFTEWKKCLKNNEAACCDGSLETTFIPGSGIDQRSRRKTSKFYVHRWSPCEFLDVLSWHTDTPRGWDCKQEINK